MREFYGRCKFNDCVFFIFQLLTEFPDLVEYFFEFIAI